MPLAPKILGIARGIFKGKELAQIISSGYMVESLDAALRVFHRGDDFRNAALPLINLGGDADTAGAIYGQLAGATYGA